MSANEEIDREAVMELLTEEELAAIDDDDLDEEEQSALREIVDEKAREDQPGDEQETGQEADETNEADDAQDDSSGSNGDADAAQGGDERIDQDTQGGASRAPYQSSLPEGLGERESALDVEEEEALRKLEAGEIEPYEYARKVSRIIAERNSLDRAKLKAEVANEIAQQALAREWNDQVAAFLKEKKEEGVDYQSNEALAADLDTIIKALANNPAHADRSGAWFLQQAHKAVKAMHGIVETQQQNPIKVAAPSRKPPVGKAPKTLAQVPGGEGPGDVGDEFADIDKLEGEAYERALSRLTPAQRERYLASA